jgi:hypothetical protein
VGWERLGVVGDVVFNGAGGSYNIIPTIPQDPSGIRKQKIFENLGGLLDPLHGGASTRVGMIGDVAATLMTRHIILAGKGIEQKDDSLWTKMIETTSSCLLLSSTGSDTRRKGQIDDTTRQEIVRLFIYCVPVLL